MVSRIFDILLSDDGAGGSASLALLAKREGRWEQWDLKTYREQSLALARTWRRLGLRKGDRVASIVRNGPEWNILDMSLLLGGMVHVPLYATLTTADYAFILKESGARVLIIEDPELWRRLQPLERQLPALGNVICTRGGDHCLSWEKLIETGSGEGGLEAILAEADRIGEDDLATIIYTSGTTGHPKGVMLSHRNLVSNFKAVAPISGLRPGEIALSALPLCHVYERMLNYAYQYVGLRIHYAESLGSIAGNLKETSAVIFCAVPRILEKFYARILEQGRDRNPGIRCVYLRAVRFGLRYEPEARQTLGTRIAHRFYDQMVYSRWRKALGKDLRIIVSGGAALQPRLARLFWAAGIRVTEGYGLTETSPVIAVNHPDRQNMKIGTVGPPLHGVQVRIADDGEILCKGPNVMMGYYLNEELTRQVIDPEGWFHTGDIGCLVDGRFLRITDRKKEMFKTSGGKYIAPQRIENRFKESSFIEHVMVVGENRRFPAAIILPDFGYIASWCQVKGHAYSDPHDAITDPVIEERIRKEVERLNEGLSQTEKIKRIALVADEWTMENGALTPTLKLRRNFLKERYLKQILELYHDGSGND